MSENMSEPVVPWAPENCLLYMSPVNPFQNLPAPEQYEALLSARHRLKYEPETVAPDDREAFKRFFFGLSPDTMDSSDIDLVQKHFPDDWRSFCDFEWGTPEERRADEEARLLEQGWERDEDGSLYIPFP